ncbi:tryptophan 7-halogenase [Temperatibacter marinus]|uniref:Tryptophan 7-halogenase n=1 Tax=Temperatibacter marinus TaxID=1456591 RepID=A0AA52HBF3_9PROT|nr:tryptophan 7-halogenase [Temperatibacter marinus]WND03578.1 tryptophan 7-halogenase [Temperatibacter marinus]
MNNQPFSSLILYGSGLAFEYTAAVLNNCLPKTVKLILLEDEEAAQYDDFYGSTMPPLAYNFNRSASLEEPDLILRSNTALSYGTSYSNWGAASQWVQCFQLPLPVWNGVRFHHYLARVGAPLEPFLPGAQVGLAGRFAHPPPDPKQILSRTEYGYCFSPSSITALLKEKNKAAGIHRIMERLTHVEKSEGEISGLTLQSGETLSAGLYIDLSGPKRQLITALSGSFMANQSLTLAHSKVRAKTESGSLKKLSATHYGWQAATPLQEGQERSTLSGPEDQEVAIRDHQGDDIRSCTLSTGCIEEAWQKNCIAIGIAAAALDPITPAPFLLLMKDIDRLSTLLPNSLDMTVESKEFNRRQRNDYDHVMLFHNAMFKTKNLPKAEYFNTSQANAVGDKLERKISQFESRGDLVTYDLEPFNEQDWTILHHGMKRKPQRYDIYIDPLSDTQINQNLKMMKSSIDALVPKVPPHDFYIDKLKAYLKNKQG